MVKALSPTEREIIAPLRDKVARGEFLSLEETATFVRAFRVSYLAAESSKGKAKSRDAKPKVEENAIDFF